MMIIFIPPFQSHDYFWGVSTSYSVMSSNWFKLVWLLPFPLPIYPYVAKAWNHFLLQNLCGQITPDGTMSRFLSQAFWASWPQHFLLPISFPNLCPSYTSACWLFPMPATGYLSKKTFVPVSLARKAFYSSLPVYGPQSSTYMRLL